MARKVDRLLVALLLVGAIGFQAQGAQAEFPERHGMFMLSYDGLMIDCLQLGRCGAQGCPAKLVLADKGGRCTPLEEFEPGRTRTTCTFKNVDFSFFAPATKQVDLDVTCSRWGLPWYWIGINEPTGSCAVEATQRRIDQFGANGSPWSNGTFNENYVTAVIGRPLSCNTYFSTMTSDQLKSFDPWRIVNRRRP